MTVRIDWTVDAQSTVLGASRCASPWCREQDVAAMPECPCDVGSVLDRLLPCTQSASCMYGAGPVLVTGGLSLIAYAASVDYRYMMPRAAEGAASAGTRASAGGRSRDWWLHAGVSGFLVGNVLYNYIRCVATNVCAARCLLRALDRSDLTCPSHVVTVSFAHASPACSARRHGLRRVQGARGASQSCEADPKTGLREPGRLDGA